MVVTVVYSTIVMRVAAPRVYSNEYAQNVMQNIPEHTHEYIE